MRTEVLDLLCRSNMKLLIVFTLIQIGLSLGLEVMPQNIDQPGMVIDPQNQGLPMSRDEFVVLR